jgi:beta-N-acetylhexosaminidase
MNPRAPLMAMLVGCALAVPACSSPRADTTAGDVVSGLSAAQLAGQMSIASFDGTVPPAALRDRIRRGQLAGVIIYTANVTTRTALGSTVRSLQAIPRPAGLGAPLLILLDQEGGEVKRVSGPPRDSASTLGRIGSTRQAFVEGEATALNLREVGANVDLAPVADVGRPGVIEERQQRTFSRDAGVVGRLATAFMQGVQSRGVAAVVKHFPGLGALRNDADVQLQQVSLSRDALRRVDEAPFATAVGGGATMVMVGNAIYPAFDRRPALLSRAIVSGELRGRLGYRGVIVGDTLTTGTLAGLGSPQYLATMAARAGIDLMIFDGLDATNVTYMDALARAAADGSLPRGQLEASVRRVLSERESIGHR